MKKIILIFICLLCFGQLTIAQEKKLSGELNDKIPVSDQVRIGKLSNGLTYYIRHNAKPEQKVEFRLVVNAGSILENDDQLGLAHFVEHMAFNGSKNFEKNELVNYLQSIGVEFGADLNAYTSFDETVYMLPIPTEDPKVVEKGLQVLEDWAHQVSFTEEEIDKERGVVLEEWRLGRGANQRMRDEWFPIVFDHSRYADRLPIGTKEVIENASYETIRNFYKDWYRPDLMAVIAVGDIDVDQMEKMIQDQFSNIEARKSPRERKAYDVPDHEETYIAVAQDKEAPFTQIQLLTKLPNQESKTLFELRRDLVHQLYNGMLSQRFDELRQSSEPPFIFGGSGYGNMVRTKSTYSSFAMVGEDGVENGLNALIVENQRVKKYGFTQGELERYKKEMLSQYEKSANETGKTESRVYAAEYIRNFLTDEPIPGRPYEYEFAKKMMPTITLEEVNQLANEWIIDNNQVVVITGPEKEGVVMPTEDQIKEYMTEAMAQEISAYEDGVSGASLMTAIPKAGSVTNRENLDELGAVMLTLSNGAKVVLKPTDFKNDEVLMSAYSFGGQSIYSDDDYYSASYASQIANQSGIATFSATDLQKLLAGKNVGVSPYIGTYSEGFSGNAAPKDIETLFQLTHLYFTEARKDSSAFLSFKARSAMLFQNLMSNPQYYFQDKVSKILSQDHPRAGGFPTTEDLEKIDFQKSYDIFKDRFSNAGEFMFFFVGNFEVEQMIPLVNTYIGSLPNTNREESWKDLNIRKPKGVIKEEIQKGTDPKSLVRIYFSGDFEYNAQNNYVLSALGEVLNNRLIDIIREEKSGVYTVRSNGDGSLYPVPSYTFQISFPCGPENVESLIQATMDEIENIKANGVSEEDLNEVKEAQRINRQENLKDNRFWLNQMRSYFYYDQDYRNFNDFDKMVESLNSAEIKKAANKYLSGENFIQVVLMPEN